MPGTAALGTLAAAPLEQAGCVAAAASALASAALSPGTGGGAAQQPRVAARASMTSGARAAGRC